MLCYAFTSDRIWPCCSSSFKSLSWKYKFELLQPVSFKGFAFFPSPFGYKIHTVLCFCSWSGVLIPSPLRDHSTFISVQGYPTAVQLLEYSFPGRNSINLSWWKSCFWSGMWFTCSFSFRLGEWHLPAGVRTFFFPFSVRKNWRHRLWWSELMAGSLFSTSKILSQRIKAKPADFVESLSQGSGNHIVLLLSLTGQWH